MTNQNKHIEYLRDLLKSIPAGPLDYPQHQEILEAFNRAYEYFDGALDTSMSVKKLNRIENLSWNPPVISFNIERHGGTVHGSSRADVYQWGLNVNTGEAGYTKTHRQLRRMDKRLNTKALAEATAKLITAKKKHAHLKWITPIRVQVQIAPLIPHTNNQTTLERRRRFRMQLTEILWPKGWRFVEGTSPHTYEKCSFGMEGATEQN